MEPRLASYRSQITAILAETLVGEKCVVYLFGSRATGTFTATSDFDIAVLTVGDINRKLSLAREKLERSNIPFKVDLIELRLTSAEFSRQVQTEGLVLWES